MFKTMVLYFSLAVFSVGLAHKISTWFRYSIGANRFTSSQRVYAAARGMAATLFSPRILTLAKVFVLDVILQIRILRHDFGRWMMHFLIFGGFTMLLLMHALNEFTSAVVFKNYYSTINPFLFLRDFFGLLVIIGVALAVYRRFIRKASRPATSPMDVYTIVIFAAILVSGIVLEGAKIMSHSVFQDMVDEYAGPQEQSSLKALEAYWVRNFGLVSPEATSVPFGSAILAEGKTIHEINCKQCHSQPQWAFMGYGASRVMTPTAAYLDRTNVLATLYYLHFLICLFGLAYLPFSKVIHIVVSPLSLLANSVMDRKTSDPANIATRQIMELDACTHCGSCTEQCSLSFIHLIIPNTNIMPSEKIASIRTLAKGKDLGIRQFMLI